MFKMWLQRHRFQSLRLQPHDWMTLTRLYAVLRFVGQKCHAAPKWTRASSCLFSQQRAAGCASLPCFLESASLNLHVRGVYLHQPRVAPSDTWWLPVQLCPVAAVLLERVTWEWWGGAGDTRDRGPGHHLTLIWLLSHRKQDLYLPLPRKQPGVIKCLFIRHHCSANDLWNSTCWVHLQIFWSGVIWKCAEQLVSYLLQIAFWISSLEKKKVEFWLLVSWCAEMRLFLQRAILIGFRKLEDQ